MRLDRAVINNQNGAVAAYVREGQLISSVGIEGYLLLRSESPDVSVRPVPKFNFSWMPLSIWVTNTNVEPINYRLDIYQLVPDEKLIFSSAIADKIYTFPPLVVNSEMQLRLQGVNSLKSILLVGKPVDILDKNIF